jgi:hypothetical protein
MQQTWVQPLVAQMASMARANTLQLQNEELQGGLMMMTDEPIECFDIAD